MKTNINDYIFSPEEIRTSEKYRDAQNDARLKIRFIALLMLAEKTDTGVVASVTGRSESSIENRFVIYTSEGIENLNSFNYKPKQRYLSQNQTEKLVIWVKETQPSSVKEIRSFIKSNFGTEYCNDAVRKLIRKPGFKFMRRKCVPGNPPSAEEQHKFIAEYNEIRSLHGKGVVTLFCDAMHLIHQAVPGYCWGDIANPVQLRTNSGRQRLNIIGSYNPATKDLIHITGEQNCNSEQVILFLEKILLSYPKAHSVVLFLDNDAYFHSAYVYKWLIKNLNIIFRFLPPYAPNLNLIERLWGFVKEKFVRNVWYETYKKFRCHVFRFLNNITQYADVLTTRMAENFEIVAINVP